MSFSLGSWVNVLPETPGPMEVSRFTVRLNVAPLAHGRLAPRCPRFNSGGFFFPGV